jgi:hypothetical protein
MDDTTGDMTTRQGDTFSFTVTGITDDWDAYFSVYRGDSRNILFEIKTKPVEGVATFNISAAESNLMTVEEGKKTATYYWNIKRCKDGVEDTVIVVGKNVSDLNKIIVYPLTTEGAENG